MAGPGGQEVGKVSVRVLPDTSKFKEDAKVKLEAIEKKLGPIEVRAEFSDAGLRASVLQAVRDINTTTKSSDAYKVRLKAIISNTAAENRKTVNEARRSMQEIAKTSNGVKLKADLVASDITAKLSEHSLKKMTDDLDDWRKKNTPIKVDVELNLDSAASRYVTTRLQVVGRNRTVWFSPAINSAAAQKVATALAALAGLRVLDDMFTKFRNFFKNLDKNVPLIGSLGLAIAGLAGWALSASSNLFALSESLAKIGPLALTLPGILGGVLLGLGASIAVLKDFNDVLPEVGAKFTSLQDKMSANFWNVFTDPMRDVIDTLFPAFSQGMIDVSSQLGGWFSGLADGLGATLGPLMASMFENLASSIDIATGATGGLANIIAVLGSVGAAQLPQFAQWFTDVTNSFSEWLTRSNDSGQMLVWIDTATQNLADLGNVLRNTGGILKDIAAAATAAGGSSLGTLAESLERIRGVTSSPEFQTGLTNTLMAAHNAMETISNKSGAAFYAFMETLGSLFQNVLPIAGAALGTAFDAIFSSLNQPAVSAGIISFFEGINTAIEALAPAMAPLGVAFGALMEILGHFASAIGPILSVALTGLAEAFIGLAPVITPLVDLLSGALLDALSAYIPTLLSLVPVILSLIAALMPLIEAILPVVAMVITELSAAIAPLIASIVDALLPVLTAIMPVVQFLADIIGVVLVPVLIFLAGVIADTVIGALNGLTNLIEGVIGYFDGMIQFFSGLFMASWGAVWTLFTEGPAAAWAQVIEGFKQMWEGLKEIVVSLGQAILGALEVLWNVGILGVFSKGVTAVKLIWKEAWTAIKTVGVEFWAAIKSLFSTFFSDLAATPGKSLDLIKKLMSDAWELIRATAVIMWDAVVSAISSQFGAATTAVGNIIQGIKDAFANPGEFLKNAGKMIIDGLISGISSMFGAVKDKLGELTGKLTSWKGPVSRDRTLLVGAGHLVMDGFLKGLQDRYSGIRKSLRGFTNDLEGTAYGSNVMSGFSGKVSGAIGGALASGGSTVNKTINYYAAQGSSIGSEEDLFAAMGRGRAVGF